MSTAPPHKICGLCGEDCSGRPRIKDPKGRYYCKTCYEEALQRQKAAEERTPVGAAEEIMDLPGGPDELVAPPPVAQSHCSGCGWSVATDAIICTNCGYDRRTGQILHAADPALAAPEKAIRSAW
ncbi:MAG: hypothetical protein ACYSXF_02535, partial [Planctomycetota bacterium]